MKQSKKSVGEWTDTLLTLRKCARSNSAALGRALDISRANALYRIRKLEEEGLVTGYIPQVVPTVFGTPYLVQVLIDPNQYQFQTELESTISSIVEFLKTSVGHAPLTVYVYQAQETKEMQINCITMTTDIEALIESLYRKENVARDSISTHLLKDAHGVPMYSQFSTLTESNFSGQKTPTDKARRE